MTRSTSRELFLTPLQEEYMDSSPSGGNLYRQFQRYISPSPPMSPIEREVLNPCEKFRRFGRIPWKLTVHLSLVIMTTLMVFLWSSNDALHLRHSAAHFHRVLLGVSGSTPSERFVEIATSEALKEQIDSSVEAVFQIGASKLTDYTLCKDPVEFQVVRRDDEGVESITLLPLAASSWRTDPTYQSLTENVTPDVVSLGLKGIVHDKFQGRFWHQCLRWTVEAVYDYGGTGLVVGSLRYTVEECSKDGSTVYSVPLTVLVLALVSGFLCMRRNRQSGWHIFITAANIVQAISAIVCMRLIRRMNISTRFGLCGLAAVLAWISILHYLKYFHVYYVLVRTLARAVPKCMRFVTGVSPILIGYALLGNCLFYQSVLFSTIGGSIATLFALLNGDIIRDAFSDLGQLVPFWGEMYLYTFLCLFIYVVLHIFISIVEESYFSAKSHADHGLNEEYLQQMLEDVHDGEVNMLVEDGGAGRIGAGMKEYLLENIKRDLGMLVHAGLNSEARIELLRLISDER